MLNVPLGALGMCLGAPDLRGAPTSSFRSPLCPNLMFRKAARLSSSVLPPLGLFISGGREHPLPHLPGLVAKLAPGKCCNPEARTGLEPPGTALDSAGPARTVCLSTPYILNSVGVPSRLKRSQGKDQVGKMPPEGHLSGVFKGNPSPLFHTCKQMDRDQNYRHF